METQEQLEAMIGKERSQDCWFSTVYNAVEDDYNRQENMKEVSYIEERIAYYSDPSHYSEKLIKHWKKEKRDILNYWKTFVPAKETWVWKKQSTKYSPFGWTLVRDNVKINIVE